MKESEGSVRKNTSEWQKARIAARQRDEERCVLCTSKEDIEVHHIDYDPDNHVLWNMITLCKLCHVCIHKPKSDSNMEQLLKYVHCLKTSHFHPEASIEIKLRYLGGFDFMHFPSTESELEKILENSYGYFELEVPSIGALEVLGEPRIVFSRIIECGNSPVPLSHGDSLSTIYFRSFILGTSLL